MSAPVHVHFLPELVKPGALRGGVAIVIDLLRATTTITHALQAGAARVVPVLEVEDARREREGRGPDVLLGGERDGLLIPGFDLGNSPGEYTAERVRGRTIVFTTTNGTRAVAACREAERVLAGCFANITAVVRKAGAAGVGMHLVCAGTGGEPALEDCVFAGALAERLVGDGFGVGNDQARMALELWRAVGVNPESVVAALRAGRGGRNLASVGLSRDIEVCAREDVCQVVPEMDGGRREFRVG